MASVATKRKLESSSGSITSFFTSKAQKVEFTTKTAAVIPHFDKPAWVESLSSANRELLQLEIDTMDTSWLAVLHGELTKPYFLSLKRFLKEETEKRKTIFPKPQDIYSWSRLTPLTDVKVVILGQDPYHNHNQAHGLAFSVNPPTIPPPSLKNIFKGIQDCYPDFKQPKNGSLTGWAKQGVLLLNACLTVEAHKANSHSNRGWEQFTEKVLEAAVNSRPSGLCFLAWGSPAAKRVDKISPGRNHLVLKSVHPSPLSASRGFFDNKHFVKANEWLLQKYGSDGVINWALDPSNVISEIQRVKGVQVTTVEEVRESVVVQQEVKMQANKSDGARDIFESLVKDKPENAMISEDEAGLQTSNLDETLDQMLDEDIDEELEAVLSQKASQVSECINQTFKAH